MKRKGFVCFLTLLSILLLPPGWAVAEKPDAIYIAMIGDFSGPYAPVVGSARPGAEDAWGYINNELGGVHGVKVKPLIMDMSRKAAIGFSKYNEAEAPLYRCVHYTISRGIKR